MAVPSPLAMAGTGNSRLGWMALSSEQMRETSGKFDCPLGSNVVDAVNALGDAGYKAHKSVQMSGMHVCTVTTLSIASREPFAVEGLFSIG